VELWLLADGEAAARSAWRTVMDRCAGDADWFLETAWDLAQLGATEDAVILLRRTVQEKPFAQSPMLLITLAWWLGEESPVESSQLLDRAAEADWAAGAPHRWESIEVLDWACRQRPESGRFLYWRGCLSNRKMDRTAAQTFWRKAVQREPRLAGARRNLGYLLFRDRRSKEAWEHYRVALAAEPHDSHLVEEASQVLCHLGRLSERVAMLKRALTRIPRCDKILRLLATALRDVGSYAESLAVMTRNEFSPWEGERTLKLCFYECHTALARLAMKSGKLDQAEKHFGASLCLPPTMGHARSHRGNDSHVLYGLGLTEWARGRWSAAQELWEQAANRRFPVGWSEGAISPVEMFSAALANLRIGRRGGARQLAEQMLESVRVVMARRKRRRGDLRAETYGWDPYRAPEQEALAHLILGDKRKAVGSFELVLDCYGPHDGTVGRLSLIDPTGPWRNRGAYEMEWLGMAL
jgi:tetratricopeptide (TPR) repeat protein